MKRSLVVVAMVACVLMLSAPLAQIAVVPNPYLARSAYELASGFYGGTGDREVQFINLPPSCVIRIYTMAGDLVRVTYLDERNSGEGVNSILVQARCVEGNLGGVRVTRAVISDQELRIRTKLKTASALTE